MKASLMCVLFSLIFSVKKRKMMAWIITFMLNEKWADYFRIINLEICHELFYFHILLHGKTDHKGNFILFRDPATPVLKMNTRSNEGGVTSSA